MCKRVNALRINLFFKWTVTPWNKSRLTNSISRKLFTFYYVKVSLNFFFMCFYLDIKILRITLNPLEKLLQIDWLMWSNINSPIKLIYYLVAKFYLIEATFIICFSIVFFLFLFYFFTEATKSHEPERKKKLKRVSLF